MSTRITRPILFAALILVALPRCSTPADPVPLWGRWEHTLNAEADPTTTVQATLTAPSGQTHTVDAFWDGGTTWRVRFMPDEAGEWRYQTTSDPAVDGLDEEGAFVSEAVDATDNPFLGHGAVRVSDDGHHLVHADGTPFFWLGDTAWNGALLSTEADWASYLADRTAKQFSAIQFVVTQWRTAYTDAAGEVAYTVDENGLTINPTFFQRLDARVDAVGEAGLLAAPVMLWALGDPEAMPVPGKLPEAQAIQLARYLVARYGANHVLWFLGGDENYSGDRAEHWKRVGRGVFGGRAHAPVTLHPQGMQWHFDAFQAEDWLDVLIYQSGHGDDANTLRWIHSGPPAQKWQQTPTRPVINSEPPYEDHVAYQSGQPHSAYTVRRAVYWSLLNAPTAGVSYGGHGIWSWQTDAAVPLNHDRSGTAQPWHEAVDMPGSQDMQHVAELFTSLPWWTLRPAQDLLAEQPGGDDPARFVAAARSTSEGLAVVYLPTGGSVRLTDVPGTEAAWFNPRDGSRSPAQAADDATFTAPDEQDWVLVLSNG